MYLLLKKIAKHKKGVKMSNNNEKQPQKVSFATWWVITTKKANFRPHMKEIIRADFGGRGLSDNETMAAYTAALKQFGYTI